MKILFIVLSILSFNANAIGFSGQFKPSVSNAARVDQFKVTCGGLATDVYANIQENIPAFLPMKRIDKKIEGALPPDTSDMEAALRAENIKLANIESNKTTRTRMEVLMKEEKDLASEYERLEGETAMIESFIVKQVSLLDEKINSS